MEGMIIEIICMILVVVKFINIIWVVEWKFFLVKMVIIKIFIVMMIKVIDGSMYLYMVMLKLYIFGFFDFRCKVKFILDEWLFVFVIFRFCVFFFLLCDLLLILWFL